MIRRNKNNLNISVNTIVMHDGLKPVTQSSRPLILIDGFIMDVNEVFFLFETSVCFLGCVCFTVWTADGSWHSLWICQEIYRLLQRKSLEASGG